MQEFLKEYYPDDEEALDKVVKGLEKQGVSQADDLALVLADPIAAPTLMSIFGNLLVFSKVRAKLVHVRKAGGGGAGGRKFVDRSDPKYRDAYDDKVPADFSKNAIEYFRSTGRVRSPERKWMLKLIKAVLDDERVKKKNKHAFYWYTDDKNSVPESTLSKTAKRILGIMEDNGITVQYDTLSKRQQIMAKKNPKKGVRLKKRMVKTWVKSEAVNMVHNAYINEQRRKKKISPSSSKVCDPTTPPVANPSPSPNPNHSPNPNPNERCQPSRPRRQKHPAMRTKQTGRQRRMM